MNDQNRQMKMAETNEEKDPHHSRDRLLTFTNWSSALSWGFYVSGGAIALGAIYFVFENYILYDSSYFDVTIIIFALIIFVISLICFFFGLFLQVLSEGMLLALDIEENTRRFNQKNK